MTGVSPTGPGCEPTASAAAASSQSRIPNAVRRWTRKMHDAMEADKGFLPAAYWPMPLVIIESPYAGEIDANVAYARAAMRDSLNRGEAPIASHLLYTQPGILRDEVPGERQWGIDAGLAWRGVAELAVFYTDRGWSSGMLAARKTYESEGFPFEERSITSAIEAVGQDREDGLGAEHESATREGDAQ